MPAARCSKQATATCRQAQTAHAPRCAESTTVVYTADRQACGRGQAHQTSPALPDDAISSAGDAGECLHLCCRRQGCCPCLACTHWHALPCQHLICCPSGVTPTPIKDETAAATVTTSKQAEGHKPSLPTAEWELRRAYMCNTTRQHPHTHTLPGMSVLVACIETAPSPASHSRQAHPSWAWATAQSSPPRHLTVSATTCTHHDPPVTSQVKERVRDTERERDTHSQTVAAQSQRPPVLC